LKTADPKTFKDYKALYEAFVNQLNYIVDLKIKVNNYIERMYAGHAPAPFLSVVIADCIAKITTMGGRVIIPIIFSAAASVR
jgi:formate C-acetyltransferase